MVGAPYPRDEPLSRRRLLQLASASAAAGLARSAAADATDRRETERADGAGTAQPTGSSDGTPLVVGYYAGNSWRDLAPEDVAFGKVTDVVFSHFEPRIEVTTTGATVDIVPGDAVEIEILGRLSDQASQHDTRIHLSLGHGEAVTEAEFAEVASHDNLRAAFAAAATDLVGEHGLDGIDIDWEPQGSTDAGWTVEKTRNLVLLLTAFRDDLDRADGERRYLSIAAKHGPLEHLRQLRQEESRVSELVRTRHLLDRVHVMTYDYHGPWVVDDEEDPPTARTGFNAPLHLPSDPDVLNVGSAADTMEEWAAEVRAWDAPGSDPSDLLTMGLPFYGRRYELRDDAPEDDTPGLGERFDGSHGAVDSRAYATISERYLTDPDYERHWHAEAEVPWLYSAADGAFVTYDDAHSIGRKVEYALDNEFAGVMIWEVASDPSERLLTAVDNRMWRALTIDGDGTDSRTDYSFTVSGDLDARGSVDGDDAVDGSTAEGFVLGGVDGYRFRGDLETYDLAGGDAVLLVDGERVASAGE